MPGGYAYGQVAEKEYCPCCGEEAHAEFCDVGVGHVQISPYHCYDCGSTEGEGPSHDAQGRRLHGWSMPSRPSERGERVTGYFVKPSGHVVETTIENGHAEYCRHKGRSGSALRNDGWIRVTNMEGFAISLPPFVTAEAARALRSVVEGVEAEWGLPYVTPGDGERGRHMSLPELMRDVAGLPRVPSPPSDGMDEGMADPIVPGGPGR